MGALGRKTICTDLVTLLVADTTHTLLKDMTTAHVRYGIRDIRELRSIDMLDLTPPRRIFCDLIDGDAEFVTVGGEQGLVQTVAIQILVAGNIPETDSKNAEDLLEEVEDVLLNLTNYKLNGGAYMYTADGHPWRRYRTSIRGNVGELHSRVLEVCFRIDGTLGVP